MTRGTDLPSPPVRGSVTSPPLLGLHFLELLLLVHRDARADYGLDLTPQHAVQPAVQQPAPSRSTCEQSTQVDFHDLDESYPFGEQLDEADWMGINGINEVLGVRLSNRGSIQSFASSGRGFACF